MKKMDTHTHQLRLSETSGHKIINHAFQGPKFHDALFQRIDNGIGHIKQTILITNASKALHTNKEPDITESNTSTDLKIHYRVHTNPK
jgi:hypothetical protein